MERGRRRPDEDRPRYRDRSPIRDYRHPDERRYRGSPRRDFPLDYDDYRRCTFERCCRMVLIEAKGWFKEYLMQLQALALQQVAQLGICARGENVADEGPLA